MPPHARIWLRGVADDYGILAVGAALLVWLALEDGGYSGIPRYAAGAVAWVFVFGVLLVRGNRALPRGPVLLVAAALAALAAVTGLSMLWTESVGRSYDEMARVLLYLGVFLGVAGVAAGGQRRRDQVLEALTLGMSLVVLLAVLSRLESGLFPAQPLAQLGPEFRPRLAYPLGYWNAVGSFVAMTIMLLLHASCRADRPRAYRAAATAFLPVAGLALYMTLSRGALISTAVAGLLLLWTIPRRLSALGSALIGALGAGVLVLLVRTAGTLNEGLLDQAAARSEGHRVLAALLAVSAIGYVTRLLAERWPLPRPPAGVLPQGRKLVVAAGVIVLAATAVAAPKLADRAAEFREPVVAAGTGTTPDGVERRLSSGSANGRYQFWEASWEAWKSNPVEGRGAGTWEFWWRRNASIDSPTRDSHSIFFDVLAELGTLGVLALVATLGSALWFCATAVRRAGGEPRAGLAAGAAASTAWLIGALTDWSWEIPALTVPFFVLIALATTARRDQGANRAPAKESHRARPGMVGGLALAAWIVVIVQAVGLGSAWSLDRSEHAVADGNLRAAEDAAEQARMFRPWSSEPWMQLAFVRVRIAPGPGAIAAAREAVEREPTNWRTWLTLARVQARSGRLTDADGSKSMVARLAKGSPLVPTYDELRALSDGTDLSLDPERP